ncbi:hypothetical protein IAE51_10915 [Lactococcus sp. S64]|uniref:hypothetical protein n=1 Tax=Lactococcus sp. S64 TaxID=2767459 RepID=UPI001907F480|nr:hypothetical protein [Lactococcus sp. S64]MBK0084405.1 hypothetical protein [Lactococcus sp. S64]
MTSIKDLNKLNKAVYRVDANYSGDVLVSQNPKEGQQNKIHVPNGNSTDSYRVVDTDCDNSLFGGSYRGMAVAPITKEFPNGDPNHVIVVSAGTNPNDWKNLASAVDEWGGFQSDQLSSAQDFLKRVQEKYTVTQLTGYSQGGYMLKIGAEAHIPTTVFNGWFRYSDLTEEERNYIKSHREMFVNFRHNNDEVVRYLDGNIHAGDDLGTIVWIDGSSHDLSSWNFDSKGNLIDEKGHVYKLPKNADVEKSIEGMGKQFEVQMSRLSDLRTRLTASGGGLSSSEKIYLDDAQALAIVSTASSEFELAMSNVMKNYQDGINESEKLWQDTFNKAVDMGNLLETWEIYEALEMVGFTQDNIVGFPTGQYQSKIDKVRTMSDKFKNLEGEIKSKISELVARDSELAQQLKG